MNPPILPADHWAVSGNTDDMDRGPARAAIRFLREDREIMKKAVDDGFAAVWTMTEKMTNASIRADKAEAERDAMREVVEAAREVDAKGDYRTYGESASATHPGWGSLKRLREALSRLPSTLATLEKLEGK